MEALLKQLRKSHSKMLQASLLLGDLRYKAICRNRPTLEQYENAVEKAYWKIDPNELLPYLSALEKLVKGRD